MIVVSSVSMCTMASIISSSNHHITPKDVILSFSTADFTYASLTIEIPAATTVFEVPVFFNVTDDDIDEVEQSFAIVAELGPDVLEVPFNFSCFQLQVGETLCFGRRGATEIRITDNDRK